MLAILTNSTVECAFGRTSKMLVLWLLELTEQGTTSQVLGWTGRKSNGGRFVLSTMRQEGRLLATLEKGDCCLGTSLSAALQHVTQARISSAADYLFLHIATPLAKSPPRSVTDSWYSVDHLYQIFCYGSACPSWIRCTKGGRLATAGRPSQQDVSALEESVFAVALGATARMVDCERV